MVKPEHKVMSESIPEGKDSTFRDETIQDIFKELNSPQAETPLGLVRATEPQNGNHLDLALCQLPSSVGANLSMI